MNTKEFRIRSVAAACAMTLGFSGAATAQTPEAQNPVIAQPPATANAAMADKSDAIAQINEATRVIREMNREPEARQLLQEAHGVFVVTRYARAGFGLGVRGGEGALLVKQDGKWSNPAFYDFAGVSGGLQAGAEAGSLVMVLNNEKAVQSFMQENNWSLNADAGLTVVAWSERAKGELGTGDIVVWSNARGLMADLAASVTDISFDEEETGAFYGRQIALRDIFTTDMGQFPHVANLKETLPGGSTQSTGGSAEETAPDAIITVVPVVPVEPDAGSQDSSGSDAANPETSGGNSQPPQGTSGNEAATSGSAQGEQPSSTSNASVPTQNAETRNRTSSVNGTAASDSTRSGQ